MTKSRHAYLLLFLSSVTVSCASWQDTKINAQFATSHCNRQNVYTYSASDIPDPLHRLKIDKLIETKISRSNLNIANAINVLDLLTKYAHLKLKGILDENLNDRMRALELKQEISQRINNASLIISAVASELDCEEERISQVANFLKNKESNLESKLTMGAIVIGASGAIATGSTIKNEAVSNTIGISTGIAEATLGILMLFNNRKVNFYHDRNALKDIWEGPAVSQNFPPFVWYYLNTGDGGDSTKTTVREQIIAKWKDFGQIGEEEEDNTKLVSLYFGKGGKYATEQLNNRADMYDQVESQINLMKQGLMALSMEIDKI